MLCLSVLSAAFASCSKNEFKLEFDLDSSVSGNYRIVYYASDKRTGFMMETIAPVEKGKCETRCITRNPTLVYVFMSGSQMPSAVIYAERGDKIRISGKDRNPALWSIGGNGLNEEWSRWRNDNARAIMSGDAAVINAAVAAYVKAHPDSELSALMMLTDFDRRADENRFAALWNSLGENARTEKTAGLAGRGDRPDAAKASLAQKAGRIRLHAIGDSLVELDPGMFAATLMYFMRNEDASVAVDMDTLRSLSRLDEEGKTAGFRSYLLRQIRWPGFRVYVPTAICSTLFMRGCLSAKLRRRPWVSALPERLSSSWPTGRAGRCIAETTASVPPSSSGD